MIKRTLLLPVATFALALLGCKGSNLSLRVDADWRQRGAETFSQVFSVYQDAHREQSFILKCPISLAESPSAVLAKWMDRRRRLAVHAPTCVPKAYYCAFGTICEEYIEYSFWDQLALSSGETMRLLTEGLADLILVLASSGFSPSSIHDLRTRGTDCVLVDLGFDLGAFTSSAAEIDWPIWTERLSPAQTTYLKNYVQSHGF